jgi:site-specific recombinase XerD
MGCVPADHSTLDPRSGRLRRHHQHEQRIGRTLGRAVKRSGIPRKVTAHTLRHSYATHLLLRGVDIRSVQEPLGHADVRTTERYTKLARAMRGEIRSSLDDL